MKDPGMTNHHIPFYFHFVLYLTYLWLFFDLLIAIFRLFFGVFPYISFFDYGSGPLQFGGLVFIKIVTANRAL